MPFFVSRQSYWGVDPNETYVVEIAGGGSDYCNPDALCAKYPGEMREYEDPREAVKVALEIAKLWKKAAPKLKISVACGYTGGYTMPFEPSSRVVLVKWANKLYGAMPKCDMCSELLPENHYTDEFGENKFCSERCAERNAEAQARFNQEEQEADDGEDS